MEQTDHWAPLKRQLWTSWKTLPTHRTADTAQVEDSRSNSKLRAKSLLLIGKKKCISKNNKNTFVELTRTLLIRGLNFSCYWCPWLVQIRRWPTLTLWPRCHDRMQASKGDSSHLLWESAVVRLQLQHCNHLAFSHSAVPYSQSQVKNSYLSRAATTCTGFRLRVQSQ